MVARDMRTMARIRSHPAKLTPIKHKAGSKEARCKKKNFPMKKILNAIGNGSRTDGCRQFTDGRSVDPFLVFNVIHQITPDNTEDPEAEVRDGRQEGILANVESKNVFHIGGQFNKEHVPSEIVTRVSNQKGPERNRRSDCLPWNWQALYIGNKRQ
jgi:hypothetical protein